MGAGTAELAFDENPESSSVEAHSTKGAGLAAGLRRARSWRVPPNWSVRDWHDELRSVALAAAWQAERDHDLSRGASLGGFVYSRVNAQALTRYRQEWRHALRNVSADTKTIETAAGADPAAGPAGAVFEALDQAMDRLPERARWLLDQLFWRQRTEACIAAELHISQPAVNKRKRAALRHLRTLL
ncbi:MAG: hypothetical protein QOD09_82 [Bradyrhizobium sp.]|jgi:RNA polymerase sigma factor (sigma-70 family)|nr:hypothetical protein [Bradyrhizobium sp.]